MAKPLKPCKLSDGFNAHRSFGGASSALGRTNAHANARASGVAGPASRAGEWWGGAATLLVTLLTISVASASQAHPFQPHADGPSDVWLDVDTANGVGDVDDGLMLIQALHSPELNIRGISTVFGNTDLRKATSVARKIVRRFGPSELTIHPGAASASELGRETQAVEAMAEALRRSPMTIAAVGPVTNVGTLLQRHPELADRIERIVVVAGRRPGQKFVTTERSRERPPRDFNFESDVEAMRVLLESDVPLVLAPWEVSSKVWISREDLRRLAGRSEAGAWIARTSQYWVQRWESARDVAAFNPYDTLAVGWLTHPDLVEGTPVAARIETGPDERATPRQREAGATKPYLHVRETSWAQANAYYLYAPQEAFKPLLLKRLAGASIDAVQPFGGAEAAHDDAPRFDHGRFETVLERFVDADGMVDYAGLKANPGDLDAYLRQLADAEPDRLSDDQRLALLINAYNAFTLKLIIERYPVDSIKSIPASRRWDHVRWELGGRTVSLNELEHEIIRVEFDEPRIHFALVCAAMDCPPLRDEAYSGLWLDAQLEDQTRHVHNHERWLRFDPQTMSLELTSLYKWYGEDFERDEFTIVDYAARYHGPLQRARRAGREVASVSFLPYDWSLNEQPGSE